MKHISGPLDKLIDALPPAARKKFAEEDRRRAKLTHDFRQACADCLADLALALRHPSMGRTDMEAAHRHMLRAMSIVAVLDPEEV